jgi:hypothetical protein
VLNLLKTKLGVSIDDSMRASLQTAATNAAGLVLNSLGNNLSGVVVDVKSSLIADAVNYMIKAAPDAIAHFGLTPDLIAQKILALLPQWPTPRPLRPLPLRRARNVGATISAWLASQGVSMLLGWVGSLLLQFWEKYQTQKNTTDLATAQAQVGQANATIAAQQAELQAQADAPSAADEAIKRLKDGSA